MLDIAAVVLFDIMANAEVQPWAHGNHKPTPASSDYQQIPSDEAFLPHGHESKDPILGKHPSDKSPVLTEQPSYGSDMR